MSCFRSHRTGALVTNVQCFHVRFGKKKIRRSLRTAEWRCCGCKLQKSPTNRPSEGICRHHPQKSRGRQLPLANSPQESGAPLFPSALSRPQPASQLPVLMVTRWLLGPHPRLTGEEEEPLDPLFKIRQPFLSHLIGQDRATCPPPHQSLAKETRLTVIGLDDSGGGLFPEPMDAQMRGDTSRLGPSPARKKRDHRRKRCGTATHICHGLLLSLLSGYLPQFPS